MQRREGVLALQGDLSELSVADVIQITCRNGKTAKLTLERGDDEALLYVEQGHLVHAVMGELKGDEVVFSLLSWDEGSFSSEPGVRSPEKSISRTYTEILLEGARRLDEGELHEWGDLYEESDSQRIRRQEDVRTSDDAFRSLADYLEIDGVLGAVRAAEDGIVIEYEFKGDFDRAGAVTSYVGATAKKLVSVMSLSDFAYGTVQIGENSSPLMVLSSGDHFVGLVLKNNMSPTHIAAKLSKRRQGGW